MKPAVFAGPSVHGLLPIPVAGIDILPPAKCGDVLLEVSKGRRVIGLVDGTFGDGPSTWHKEIIYALDSGCAVLGAASMGALRAAECAVYGMVGVGRIYEDYQSGRRSADADVALLYGPAEMNYVPVTVPLVDAEEAIARLATSGLLNDTQSSDMLARARSLNFRDRSWERLLGPCLTGGSGWMVLRQHIAAGGLLPKAADALLLLNRIKAVVPPARPIAPTAARTSFFVRLLEDVLGTAVHAP